jgi:subfamily B ATP-binding cassette protein MsbA
MSESTDTRPGPEAQVPDRGSYRKLLRFFRPYRGKFALSLVAMAVYSSATGAVALLVKNVLDDIFISRDAAMLRYIPAVVVGVYLVKGIAFFVHTYLMKYIGQAIIRDLRNAIFDHVVHLPLSFFTRHSTGGILSRALNDVGLVQFAVTNTLTSAVRDPLTIVALVGVLLYRSWPMALMAFLVFPLGVYPLVRFGRSFRKVTRKSQDKVGLITTLIHETITGIKIVAAFGMEEFEKRRFHEENQRLFSLSLKTKRIESLSPPLMEALGSLGVAGVVVLGGNQVIRGDMTAGEFFSFMTALLLLYEPFKRLTTVTNATQEALAASDRIFEILETPNDIKEKPGAVDLPRAAGRVVFHDVAFGYGHHEVLRGINLVVESGEVVAFVGSSGGGKSTLLSLLPRFYDVTAGAITIDGYDVRDVTLASLRARIAMVTQETILFNDTVAANIAYGRRDAGPEEIRRAARMAYAEDFIARLPQGYETAIGERGVTLSGGERQRLCIARALLADAPILILDEATSSLDAESEQLVQKALENLMVNRTTFIIAHRLATVVRSPRIAVLSGRTISQVGTHQELMDRNETYRRLYHLQFSDPTVDAT